MASGFRVERETCARVIIVENTGSFKQKKGWIREGGTSEDDVETSTGTPVRIFPV